ncbi:MAG: VanW family protein [Clostridia bacterium]|nr:VanW family protein [Clostridia bacterium]
MQHITCKKIKYIIVIMAVNLLLTGSFLLHARAYPLAKINQTLTVVALGKEYSFCYPEIDVYKGEPYLKNAEEVVDGIYFDTIIRPQDAKAIIHPENDNPFELISEANGKCIDKEDLLIKIDRSLKLKVQKIYASEIVLKPAITMEMLKKSTYKRAFFTTNYIYSSEERKHNIGLCAKYIGGVMLKENQEFSFNEVVGERTEERGFKSARIIEKGKFTDGIGGGVCQVSSTLYNAVLLGGLRVTERHAHSMAVSYVEPSFDAMVSMGYADLKFVNDTGGIIFIIAFSKGDSITVSVYGERGQLTYKRVSEVIEKIQPNGYLKTPSDVLAEGEERIVVYEKEGIVSKGLLEVYKNGKFEKTVLLSSDRYAPLQGEIIYGKKHDIS